MSGSAGAAGGGAIYGLGIFGALVCYDSRQTRSGITCGAIFQGLFWPAFMVYEVFEALAG